MRPSVFLRNAEHADASALANLWAPQLRRCEAADQVADVLGVVERSKHCDDERVVVAEYDGQLAGAIHLRATTVSALNLEPVVHALSPTVLPKFRRHGVGRLLMEAAVGFAEERGIGYVATAVAIGARDANRWMARLSLSPAATLRVAPTALFRARLGSLRHPTRRPAGRHLTRVVAARRTMRGREQQTSA